jgi:hypothetical protein
MRTHVPPVQTVIGALTEDARRKAAEFSLKTKDASLGRRRVCSINLTSNCADESVRVPASAGTGGVVRVCHLRPDNFVGPIRFMLVRIFAVLRFYLVLRAEHLLWKAHF